MDKERGFVLRQVEDITAPTLICESCGEVIRDYGLAWVMWSDLLRNGAVAKPILLCKKNGCNSKPPYIGYASMELGDYLINLCRNAGMKSEQQFREALEFANLGDQI
jgi:hypothetical protein